MYTKEFCLSVANSRAEQDPEAARVIKWLLDAIEETEAAARALKESNAPTRTALQWLQTLINSPAVEWNPDQRAAAQAAHDAALVASGPLAPPRNIVQLGRPAAHYGPVLKCNVPPSGWECSRPKGHPGPCAATESAGGPDHG